MGQNGHQLGPLVLDGKNRGKLVSEYGQLLKSDIQTAAELKLFP
jgi:hypothetical protein